MKYILLIITIYLFLPTQAIKAHVDIEHFEEYVKIFNQKIYTDKGRSKQMLNHLDEVTKHDTTSVFRLRYYVLKWEFEMNYGEIESSRNSLKFLLGNLSKYSDDIKGFYYNKIAQRYSSYRMYDLTEHYFRKTLSLNNIKKNSYYYITALNGISDIYRVKNEMDSAKYYVFESIQLLSSMDNPQLYGNSIRFLSNVYFSKGVPDSAFFFLQKYHKEEYLANSYYSSSYYVSMGYYYFLIGNLDSSIHYGRKDLYARQSIDNLILRSSGMNNLGEAFMENGQLDSAKYYLELARDSLQLTKNVHLIKLNIKHLEKLYGLTHDSEGLEKLNLLSYDNDSINKLQIHKVNLLTKLYETNIKLEESNKKNEDYELFITILIVLTILITLFIIFALYYALRLKEVSKKQNTLISDKIETLKKLEIEINNKNKLLSILSHDMINPINSSMQLLTILKQDYNNMSDEERLEIILELSRASINTYDLLKDILNWLKVSNDKIYNYNPMPTKIFNLVQNIYEHLHLQLENKDQKLINDLNRDVVLNVDSNLMSTIIRNIITNASKYSNNGKNIKIYSKNTDSTFIIFIEDQGFGMNKEILKQLRTNNTDLSSGNYGDNNNSFGYGLLICKDFIKVHKGKIEYESEENVGTIVKLIFSKDIIVS